MRVYVCDVFGQMRFYVIRVDFAKIIQLRFHSYISRFDEIQS